MKLKQLAVIVILALATIPANAGLAVGPKVVQQQSGGDVVSGIKAVNRYFKKRPTQKHAILSTGECAAGIAFSSNPIGAAAVGLPVLALGNSLSYFLRNAEVTNYTPNDDVVSIVHNFGRYVKKHPTMLADASGSFCLSYGLSRTGRKPAAKTQKPGDPGDGGGNGGGDGGSGNGGGNGGGSGSGGSGGGNSGGGGDGGGSGGGGNGGGSGSGCQQDCGLPGNGGVNSGHDGNKPPFPGKPKRPGH